WQLVAVRPLLVARPRGAVLVGSRFGPQPKPQPVLGATAGDGELVQAGFDRYVRAALTADPGPVAVEFGLIQYRLLDPQHPAVLLPRHIRYPVLDIPRP